MRNTHRRLTVLLPALITALACNSLTGNAPPPPTPTLPPGSQAGSAAALSGVAPSGAAASTAGPTGAPTAAPTPEPPAPLSGLMDNLETRVAAGEWTEEQGLVTTMKFGVGEAPLGDVVASGRQIVSFEGSPVVRAAAAYIATGPDAATKTELKRLLDLLFPDPARLDLYSAASPAPASWTGGPSLGRRRSSAADAATPPPVDCVALWQGGFPEGAKATCFITRTAQVAGQEYRLYTPASVEAGDTRQALADAVMEAVKTAVTKYTSFGPMPPADLVWILLPNPKFDASTRMLAPGEHCHVALDPKLAPNNVDYIQQVIAHELFHCYQYKNYFNKMSVYGKGANWWVEGTAEFFSNVAYPKVNEEYSFLSTLDDESRFRSLVDIDYPDFLFFQYMENRGGVASVLDLISRMPESGGRAEQLQALAGVPGIRELFNHYARAYVDETIRDTGGNLVVSDPAPGKTFTLSDSGSYSFNIRDFVVERGILVFPAKTKHILEETATDVITMAVRLQGPDAKWRPLPQTLQACKNRQLRWLATMATADGSAHDYEFTDQVTHENAECDSCLVGRWQMNNTSYWNVVQAFASAIPQQYQAVLQSFDGQAIVEFTADGSGTTLFDSLHIHSTQDYIMGGLSYHNDSTHDFTGPGLFDWDTTGHAVLNLDFSQQPRDNVVVNVTRSGSTLTTTTEILQLIPPPGQYQCTAKTLLITPTVLRKLGALEYDKISP